MTRALVTGGAGFIGSNLADRCWPTATRSSSTTTSRPASGASSTAIERSDGATIVEGDVLDRDAADDARSRAATSSSTWPPTPTSASASSTRAATSSRTRIATFSVLEAMRADGDRRGSPSRRPGSVYGEPEVFPTPEDAPFPVQTSLYGASKLAGEGLIEAYCDGLRLHRRHLPLRLDARRALHARPRLRLLPRAAARIPTRLTVLGDGRQRKSYLYVGDCVDGDHAARRPRTTEPGV